MNYRLEFLTKARLELLEAWIWYEDRQTGLGDRFKKQIDTTIKLIEQNPEQYRETKRNYRQAPVKIFPYLLVYKIYKRKKIVAIVSVFHTHRNPKKKHKKK